MLEEAAWKVVVDKVCFEKRKTYESFLNNCVVVTLENIFTANLNSLSLTLMCNTLIYFAYWLFHLTTNLIFFL